MAPGATPSSEATGFRLTRTFAIYAAIMLGVAAWLTYRTLTTASVEHLIELTSRHNAALTQAVANSLWPGYGGFIDEAQALGRDGAQADPRQAALKEDVRQLMAGTSVMKVKLYDLHGFTAFSTQLEQVGSDYSSNPRYLGSLAGRDVSILEFRDSFGAMDGPRASVWVLSSYIPVRVGPDRQTVGVAEIYNDVTALYLEIEAYRQRQLVVIGGIFTSLFAVLVVLVWMAEREIRQHHVKALRMAESAARAEAANEAKTEFLANMSHELRTPLNAIIGFAEMIRGAVLGPVGNLRYQDYAGDIAGSGRHLLGIINDVLELVRVETRTYRMEKQPVDIGNLIGEIGRILAPDAEKHAIAVHCAVEQPSLTLSCDANKLRQVVINIASNAIKFTPEHGMVHLTAGRNADGAIFICISDTGIGMRAEDIPVALAPFGQIASAFTRGEPGTGLGLPLSKRFTELLGGQMEIDSAPGQGTRVTLLFRPETAVAAIAA